MLTSISLQKRTYAFFKEHLPVAASYRKTPVLESLFNSEYCEMFKSTYFEEHLWTAASLKICSWNWEKLGFIHKEF